MLVRPSASSRSSRKHTADDFPHRANRVRQFLLGDRSQQCRAALVLGCQIQQVAGNALAHRAENIASKGLQDLVQPPRDFFRLGPREACVGLTKSTNGARLSTNSVVSVTA
jgi:hypothetical protein